jgi:hypothetical protein
MEVPNTAQILAVSAIRRHIVWQSCSHNFQLGSNLYYLYYILQRVTFYLTDKVLKIRTTCLYYTDISQKR